MATKFSIEEIKSGCKSCESQLNFDFTFAYQPIVDIQNKTIFGYEALVRDPVTRTAKTVLDKVNDHNRYAFDQACRKKAIGIARQLNLNKILSINFLPNAVYEPEHCIKSTLRAAKAANFPINQIMFEITESEEIYDKSHLKKIFQYYESQGFITALDDFGAGFAGLNMLSAFIPKVLKIDMELVSNIDQNETKKIIVTSLIDMCQKLGITVLAEGIERKEEAVFFVKNGVYLLQGYFFAKPEVECLPEVELSIIDSLYESSK
ncbi:EAL domain-containing protein [Hydrogenovibrio sp. JE_KL2]|uniref:EAL domain-containing protein n=1 Tax=Hydrogenovibrio sp. JE_KL2 TaxID=2651188 RepID=UPI00135570D1|nr:EAL domain-containing protein [Hydrogenovibrio sp. JE_KL2]